MAGQEYSVSLGLDILPISKDPDNLPDLYRLYNAVRIVTAALDTYTGALGASADSLGTAFVEYLKVQNQCRLYLTAGVSIGVGQLVKIDSSKLLQLGTVGNVIGWAPAPITAGTKGEIRLFGLCAAVGGLVAGTTYYASSTPGGISSSATSQPVGVALDTNLLWFKP